LKAATEASTDVEPIEVRFAGPWLIPDAEYLGFVRRLFSDAKRLCFASLFLVGESPWRAREFVMDGLLLALVEARWRGVDARLLVGGSRSSPAMIQMAEAARKRARVLRVPCRWLTNIPKLAGHAKVVIADSHVLVGSHNWTNGGVDAQSDSVCVASTSLALRLEKRFEQQWQVAGQEAGEDDGIPA
jgi:phosphatidylserine/phosphatidylglycerophosphate/cardiolipin synthase-like enzyme